LEKYYTGQISFSEITIEIFKRDPFDAYYILSFQKGKQFKAISPAVSSSAKIDDKTKFVLDVTSVCLLYELSKEHQLIYTRKFTISGLLRALLLGKISDTRNSPPSELSVTITQERVYPRIYPEDFTQKRIQHLESILVWVDANCEIVEVAERFNFIMSLPEKHKADVYFQLILDNKLLADRENSILLTDDIFYYTKFHCPSTIVAGPQVFLNKYHTDKEKEITQYLLEHNYIGVPMSADLLYEELLKFLGDKENRYAICLENLRYNWNPAGSHAGEAIKFIKSLYLRSFLNDLTRHQVISSVLSNLIVGLPLRNLQVLPRLIMREFKLLPMQLIATLDILTKIVESRAG
jgi:hypothetical protein